MAYYKKSAAKKQQRQQKSNKGSKKATGVRLKVDFFFGLDFAEALDHRELDVGIRVTIEE